MSGMVGLPERILSKFTIADEGCWLWHSTLNHAGYAVVSRGTHSGGMQLAHRVIYEHLIGAIPTGHHLHHRETCPHHCVNPHHLTPITPSEHARLHRFNNAGWATERSLRTHCSAGHELTPENTRIKQNRDGPVRICRACQRERSTATQRLYRARKRKEKASSRGW